MAKDENCKYIQKQITVLKNHTFVYKLLVINYNDFVVISKTNHSSNPNFQVTAFSAKCKEY